MKCDFNSVEEENEELFRILKSALNGIREKITEKYDVSPADRIELSLRGDDPAHKVCMIESDLYANLTYDMEYKEIRNDSEYLINTYIEPMNEINEVLHSERLAKSVCTLQKYLEDRDYLTTDLGTYEYWRGRKNSINIPDYIKSSYFICLSCGTGPVLYDKDVCVFCKQESTIYSSENSRLDYHESIYIGSRILEIIDRLYDDSLSNDDVVNLIKNHIKRTWELSNNKEEYKFVETWIKSQNQVKNLDTLVNFYLYEYRCNRKNRITAIRVKNLFGYYSYTMKLSEKNKISMILGPNGFGKTTVFKLIDALLFNSDSTDDDVTKILCEKGLYESIEIFFSDGSSVRAKQTTEKERDIVRNAFKDYPIKDYPIKDYSITCFPRKDIYGRIPEDPTIKELYPAFCKKDYFLFIRANRDFSSSNRKNSLNTLGAINSTIKQVCKCVEDWNGKKPNGEPELNIDYALNVNEGSVDFMAKATEKIPRLHEELCNCMDRLLRFKKAFEGMYDPELPSGKTIEYRMDSCEIYAKTTGKKLSLESLSSGEKNVFNILGLFTFITTKDSMVLIDEPEISLHLLWQEKLIKLINEMVSNIEDIQVIIATHSPFICSFNDEDIADIELSE